MSSSLTLPSARKSGRGSPRAIYALGEAARASQRSSDSLFDSCTVLYAQQYVLCATWLVAHFQIGHCFFHVTADPLNYAFFFCCCHSLECATHVSAATKPPEIIKCVRILYVNHYVGARHAPMSGRFHPIIKCVRPSQKSSWSAEKYTTFFDPLAEIISVPERNSLNTFKKKIMIKVFHGLKLPCFYPILDEQKLGICRII